MSSNLFQYLHDRYKSGGSVAVVGDDSLQEHDEREHGGHYDPETMTCKLREEMGAETLDPDVGETSSEAPIPANAGRDAHGRPCGIGHIYTGSAADYDKPSLLKIGTGEGQQVYGWGLYGSNVRGVAENYAGLAIRAENDNAAMNALERKFVELGAERKFAKDMALSLSNQNYSVENYRKRADEFKNGSWAPFYEDDIIRHEKELAFLEKHKDVVRETVKDFGVFKHVYEQTFFTNRAPGDESHLLNWYEPVSEENLQRVVDRLNEEYIALDGESVIWKVRKDGRGFQAVNDIMSFGALTGEDLYRSLRDLLGNTKIAEKAASEFLVRADIDGIKYPVDSYGGKTVKDGDKAGWNYVSFRDDNICVNGKFVDGKEVPVSMDEALTFMRRRMLSTEDTLSEFLA